MPPLCELRPNSETPTNAGKPSFRRNNCEKDEPRLNLKTGWWGRNGSKLIAYHPVIEPVSDFRVWKRQRGRSLSTNSFHVVGRHVVPVIVVEMSPQIIHDGSNLIVAHHRSEWWHSALSVNDNFDWISAGFEISVSRK